MRLLVDSAWVGGSCVRGVALRVEGERIASLERAAPAGRGLHALPAFVNAHSHLELSAIRGEALAHATFAQWIEQILAARAACGEAAIDGAIRSGAVQLLATGTAAIGDIDPTGRAHPILRETPLEGVVYHELLGTPEERSLDELGRALAADSAAARPGAGLRRGVSPHAPYSTGESLYRRALGWSRDHGVPLASHVAELDDEEEFLVRDAGPLAELFRARSFAKAAWSDERSRPFRRIVALDPPPGFVVIHGNRLTASEIACCAARRWPIVCCPRSHRYFGRARHPAARILEAGGILALGTDSRASNDGLDLWAELACLRASDPELADGAILRAATAGGREALGLEPAELRPGEPATFQLVAARDGAALDPARLEAAAVRGELSTRHLFVRGRLVVGDPAELPIG